MKLFLVTILSALASATAFEQITNGNIKTAATAWMNDKATAKLKYSKISLWKTGDVINMDELFKDAASFDEDLSKWDVSKVTSM